jgi:hypothetical protein
LQQKNIQHNFSLILLDRNECPREICGGGMEREEEKSGGAQTAQTNQGIPHLPGSTTSPRFAVVTPNKHHRTHV